MSEARVVSSTKQDASEAGDSHVGGRGRGEIWQTNAQPLLQQLAACGGGARSTYQPENEQRQVVPMRLLRRQQLANYFGQKLRRRHALAQH